MGIFFDAIRTATSHNPNGFSAVTLSSDGNTVVHRSYWKDVLYDSEYLAKDMSISAPKILSRDRVAILGNNCEHLLQLLCACDLKNLIAVPLNTRWRDSKLARAIDACSSSVIVLLDKKWESLLENYQFPSVEYVIKFYGSFGARISVEENISYEKRRTAGECALDGICSIMYTSGTTGNAKGVMLTNEGQSAQALEKVRRFSYSKHSVYLNVLPLFHVGGLSSTLAITFAGGTHVFLPHYEVSATVCAVKLLKVSVFVVVPTMLNRIYNCEAFQLDTNSLQSITSVLVGGQSMSSSTYLTACSIMPNATFTQTYACTEAGSSITFETLTGINSSFLSDSCIGSPSKFVDMRIRAAPGSVGEIETKGIHVMRGYWNDPLSTARVLQSGWLKTGDLGYQDMTTRKFHFVGRLNDIIKTGGESVNAREVEKILIDHQSVKEVCVYGIPDDDLVECVAAAVVLDSDENVGLDIRNDLIRWCQSRLTKYMCPKKIFLVSELPRNSSGKVMKHKLMHSKL